MRQRSHSVDPWPEHVHGSYEGHLSANSVGNQHDKVKSIGNTSIVDPTGTLVLHHDLRRPSDAVIQSNEGTHSEGSKVNGTVKMLPAGQSPVDNAGFSSPSTTSFSPGRYLTSNANKGSSAITALMTFRSTIIKDKNSFIPCCIPSLGYRSKENMILKPTFLDRG